MSAPDRAARRQPEGERAHAAGGRGAPLHIGYLPFGGEINPYSERFIDLLGELGTVAPLPQLRSVLRNPAAALRRYDVAVVNWIELDLVGRDGRFSVAGFLRVVARVLFFKRIARRLAYVRHNHFPHGTRARDAERARRAIDLVERMCDVVLIHSGHALDDGRRRYVPHPLYRRAATALSADERALLGGLPADFYVVFGRMERYKRIDALAAAFPSQRRLLVFGAVEDQDYVAELQRRAGPQVRIQPGFVSDALAQAVIRRSRGVVLAHADADMIVSGTLFYALSIGARVFAVRTPALAWIRQRIGDDAIHLADDIAGLCALIAADTEPPAEAEPQRPPPRVEAEFGDHRIKAALREVLLP